MPRRVGSVLVVIAALVALAPVPAARAASATKLVGEAREKLAAGDLAGAAASAGAAVSAAHAAHDLLAEREAALCVGEVLGSAPAAERSTSVLGPEQAELAVRILGALDPEHLGAFVSAHDLATRLVYAATERGETMHAQPAADALAKAAAASGTGRGVAALARYAHGVAVRETDVAAADADLEAALDAAEKEKWVDLAAHAGTELAWLRIAGDDVKPAETALRRVAKLFEGDVSADSVSAWTRAVQARVQPGQEALSAIVAEASRRCHPSTPTPAVQTVRSGKSKATEFGRAYKRASSKTRLVSVARDATGFRLERCFDPKSAQTLLARSCAETHDEDGLSVATRGAEVALADARTENYDDYGVGRRSLDDQIETRIAPVLGGGSGPPRAWYPLGRGETWTLTKGGTVRIE